MKRGTVVLAVLPFTDLTGLKRRPAVIVSPENRPGDDVVIAFITSSKGDPLQPTDLLIEAENEPQVRGAILNLFLHPAPKALLLLMTRNLYNPLPEALAHFQAVWNQLTGGSRGALPIICLVGDGKEPAWEEDETRLRIELPKFGIK